MSSITYIARLLEQMEILLLLGRLPNDGRVRRHFPHIGQIFQLLVIGRIGNDEGMPADLREEIGGRPRRGGGGGGSLHAQRRGTGVVVGAAGEGGSRAPRAGRVEGGGEEKEGGPRTGVWGRNHAAAAAAAYGRQALCITVKEIKGGMGRLERARERICAVVPSRRGRGAANQAKAPT